MNKDQLKQSLHELSPSEEQKQRMLQALQTEPQPTRSHVRPWWRWASALAVLVIAVVLWRFAIPKAEQAASEEIAIDKTMVAEASQEEKAERTEDLEEMSDFDEQLSQTPWRPEQRFDSLPVFVRGLPLDSDAAIPHASTGEPDAVQALLEFAVYAPSEKSSEDYSLTISDRVAILNYSEAIQRLLKNIPELQEQDIEAGFLSYSDPEAHELIFPIYRFRYRIDGEVQESELDARR